MESSQHRYLLPLVILLAVLVGLLSGAYPALFLARFKPVEGIKGDFVGRRRAGFFRRTMVIVQFTISVAIIVGTFIVSNQLRYMLNKDLGFDSEKILLLTLNDTAIFNNVNAFSEEIKRHPAVEETSLS